jgi:hypothetical protein
MIQSAGNNENKTYRFGWELLEAKTIKNLIYCNMSERCQSLTGAATLKAISIGHINKATE